VANPFPLPPPPNFRVAGVEPTHIRLTWSDYPLEYRTSGRLRGFRLYRSSVKGELGRRIADETILETGTFQYDDYAADAGADRFYTLVAVEKHWLGRRGHSTQVPTANLTQAASI
jgi:hypothetical protein